MQKQNCLNANKYNVENNIVQDQSFFQLDVGKSLKIINVYQIGNKLPQWIISFYKRLGKQSFKGLPQYI